MKAIDEAVLGRSYQAFIQHIIALKPATGETEEEFTLLDLVPPKPPATNSPVSALPSPPEVR
jgi:hypothetical protein